jgi:cysteine-rich repeat protein
MKIATPLRAIGAAIVVLSTPALLLAHGTPAPLAQWGNFADATADCQRAIGRAAGYCATRAVRDRGSCIGTEAGGGTCDRDALEQASVAVRARALALVERYCTSTDLQNLNYVDFTDVLIDIGQTCRETDTAATSAVWGPVMVGGSVAAANDRERACLESSSRAATRLLRFALRVQQRALDRIAGEDLTTKQKDFELARARQFVARISDRARARLAFECPEDLFSSIYGRGIGTVLDAVAQRAECVNGFVYVVDGATQCPAPECGNGVQENGEECDDGNAFEGDACLSDCKRAQCDSFANTYDLIQKAIFENRGCTAELCHSSQDQAGGLDLTAGNSYGELVDVPAATALDYKRVDPGNRANSLLWLNVAAKLLPEEVTAPLRAMPLGPTSLTANEVEALRLWIESGGATRTETVPGTAELLDACLPEPEPIEIQPLAPPPPDEGVQLHMPVWELDPQSESEVCFTSYYDLTGKIPGQYLSEDGTRFRYSNVEIRQDPLSHHLIVDFFRGTNPPDDPVWGIYSCVGGPNDGDVCDPLDLAYCGSGDCATDPDPEAIACIGFGPQQGLGTLTSGGFAFAQETTAVFDFPAGVYDEVPIKGNVLWNSHAFNLTRKRGKLEAWVNIYFPAPDQQVYPQEQIFNATKIFWDVPFVSFPPRALMPFEEHEICHIHTFGRAPESFVNSPLAPSQTAHLFEISGHMHEHGKRFQIYRGMFTCGGGMNAGQPCSPRQPEMCPASQCREIGGRSPDDALLYTNFIYNDPLVLRFDEPIAMRGDAPVEDRSFTFCAHYENGVAPNFHQVKRRSTSPPGGTINPFGITIGGPCAVSQTRCIGGPNHNQLCNGDHAFCDSTPGAGDGDCDACPLTGGFRTQDEMFIMFGNYWVTTN